MQLMFIFFSDHISNVFVDQLIGKTSDIAKCKMCSLMFLVHYKTVIIQICHLHLTSTWTLGRHQILEIKVKDLKPTGHECVHIQIRDDPLLYFEGVCDILTCRHLQTTDTVHVIITSVCLNVTWERAKKKSSLYSIW